MHDKLNPPKLDKTRIAPAGPLEGIMERVFDAPPEGVWRAHTDPAAIPRWWGPAYLTTRVDRLDVRPGGGWRFVQHDPDGNEHAFHGEYREVVPHERLVQTFVHEPFPDKEILETYTFEPLEGGRTRLRVVSRFPDRETLQAMLASGMNEGARETWERLARHVVVAHATTGAPEELVTTRTLDAPVEEVYAAFTDPKRASEWWGPNGFSTTTTSHDLRVGGHWAHVMHGPDGTDYTNYIHYTSVEPLRRLAWTHGVGADAPPLFHAEVEFERLGEDQTLVRLRHRFPTRAARDENVRRYGSIDGAYDTLARLAEIVETTP